MLYKAVLKGRYPDASETRNVFYATTEAEGNDASVALQGWIATIVNILRVGIGVGFLFYGIDIYKYVSNEVWEMIAAAGLNLAGQEATSEMLPHQSSAVLLGNTANGKSKAKKFIPGITEGASLGGLVQPGTLAVLASAAAAWIADYVETLNSVEIHPVLHRKGKTDLDFTGGVVDAVFGTQRRRKQGIGI